jgi:hypothetical protein
LAGGEVSHSSKTVDTVLQSKSAIAMGRSRDDALAAVRNEHGPDSAGPWIDAPSADGRDVRRSALAYFWAAP